MFVSDKPFQSNLIFVGEAKSLPLRGAPKRCFTWIGYGLTHKRWTRLERLARDKHSSLSQKNVNCGHKKFYNTGPGMFRNFYLVKFTKIVKCSATTVTREKLVNIVESLEFYKNIDVCSTKFQESNFS